MQLRLETTFVEQLSALFLPAPPQGFPSPELLVFHDELAESLGLTELRGLAAEFFSGNRLLEGSKPVAMAYAGHQFGSFNPQLGDGRAVLLGEVVDARGRRFDLQLKGSGRTQFSRGGDGKAALGPVLREALVSEAMHHLGIPTTRVLAALSTGEIVQREQPLPGAVLCRVAASHLRIGSLEFLAARQQTADLEKLVEYTLQRHYPDQAGGESPALSLLRSVARAQADLIAEWMLVGFIHGVMNTDNMTLSGETIDYGPCAFMDTFAQNTVFSSIDAGGRYSYKNQPLIGKWNLARLAEAVLPLLAPEQEAATQLALSVLEDFDRRYQQRLLRGMRRKLGLKGEREEDLDLVQQTLGFLEEAALDYTGFFRSTASDLRDFGEPQFGPMGSELRDRYLQRLEGESLAEVAARMDRVNPLYIPRNHLVEEVLAHAHEGKLEPFFELARVLSRPFDEQEGRQRYQEPAAADFGPYKTFCGT